ARRRRRRALRRRAGLASDDEEQPHETTHGCHFTANGVPNQRKRKGLTMKKRIASAAVLAAGALLVQGESGVQASSHREAPFITKMPKVDGTDFYMFKSYEAERSDFITLVADYLPLQDAYGGPNFFMMDPQALYEIHIDNDGDAKED